MVGALDVPVDLRAEESLREGVLGIARHAYGAPILNGDEHCARVRAVVRAGAADDLRIGEGERLSCHGSLGDGVCKARGVLFRE